jgi:hypothetical protein
MDEQQFDQLTVIAHGLLNRRQGLLRLLGSVVGVAISLAFPQASAASCLKDHRRCGGRHFRNCSACCSRNSEKTKSGKRFCRCRKNGSSCQDASECCGQKCEANTCVAPIACVPEGAPCEANNPCCGTNLSCHSTGRCGKCMQPGRPCTDPGECCKGLPCYKGRCRVCSPLTEFCGRDSDCCGELICREQQCFPCSGPDDSVLCNVDTDCCGDLVCDSRNQCVAECRTNGQTCATEAECCAGRSCDMAAGACCINPFSGITCNTHQDCCPGSYCQSFPVCETTPCGETGAACGDDVESGCCVGFTCSFELDPPQCVST